MKVEDFDETGDGSILVRVAKAGKARRVLLTKEGRAFFQSITAGLSGNELIFRRDAAERRTRGGDPLAWGKNDQQRIMKDACKAAGLPEMGFHQLRHSYASALVAAGMPLALVAKLTGHADTRMLERHYAHLASSDLSRALEAMAPSLNLPIGNMAALSIKVGPDNVTEVEELKVNGSQKPA
ncbi:MAG: tyrosine-type recombinase/integrase [Holophaga sp.]|nr:tyrosine-type recombinase/integrase [Holophaga sp.]